MIETPGQEKGGQSSPFLVHIPTYAYRESQPHSWLKNCQQCPRPLPRTQSEERLNTRVKSIGLPYAFDVAERARIKAAQRNPEDANEFALKLLLSKALKKNGSKMFADGMYAEQNEWPAAELEAAMLLLIAPEDSEGDVEELLTQKTETGSE